MNKTVEYYMNLPYKPIVEHIWDEYDEEYIYVITIKEMPGLMVVDADLQVALYELEDTKELWIESNLELGREMLEPTQ